MRTCFRLMFTIGLTTFYLSSACNSSRKMMAKANETEDYRTLKRIALKEIKKKSKDIYVLLMLGKVYLFENMPDSAVFYLESAYQVQPDNPIVKHELIDSKIILGDTLLKRESIMAATKVFQSAVELDSSHFLAQCRLGLVYKKIGYFDKARNSYRKALRLNSLADSLQRVLDFFDAAHVQSNLLMNKGIELIKQNRFQQAKETLSQAVDAKPDNEDAKYQLYLANGLFSHKRGSVGKLWEAIESFGLASTLRPLEPEPHFYMAEAYLKKDDEDFENAIHEYEEVIRLAPESELANLAQKKISDLKARERLLREFWKKK